MSSSSSGSEASARDRRGLPGGRPVRARSDAPNVAPVRTLGEAAHARAQVMQRRRAYEAKKMREAAGQQQVLHEERLHVASKTPPLHCCVRTGAGAKEAWTPS